MKMNTSDEEIEKNKSTHKCSVNCNCSASQKRPMNAFLIFCKRHRSVVKQKYPHLENRSITKILGEWWAKIDIEQKQKYTELARQYKEAFMKANPHFKWYKTDIKLQSNMQPCSPPSFVSTFSNSNSSLNCSLYNNINYQNESDNSQLQKTNKLNSKNPNELIFQSCSNIDKCNNNSNTLTPKPPKKRYLENGEFKELGIQSNLNNNSTKNEVKQNKTLEKSSTSENKNYAIGGPPVLDVETMNRVIENAFEANDNLEDKKFSKSHKNNSSQLKLFSSNIIKQSKSTDCSKNETLNYNRGEKPNDLRCTEKFNELIEGSDSSLCKNFGNKQNKRSRSNSPTKNGIEKLFVNNSSPSCNLDKDKTKLEQNKNDKEEDKPLNLSSTTTLKASQQVLIDNLIDKLLSNGAEGNPMPIEMLRNSSSNCYTSTNSNLSSKNNQQRKERSCKGKRYLEMLNENKLSKRTKNQTTNGNGNSSSSIGNNLANEENGNKSNSSQANNTSSGSKWVSGGFDLEEHIAALPQLGDNHLISVLDSTKANLIISSQQRSNNNNSTIFSGKNDKDNSNNNLINNDQKQDLSDNNKNSSFNYSQTKNSSIEKKQCSSPHESLNDNRVNDSQLSNSSSDLAEKIVERLNINSQALECDGLVALAEVALQQAHRISSPSCT